MFFPWLKYLENCPRGIIRVDDGVFGDYDGEDDVAGDGVAVAVGGGSSIVLVFVVVLVVLLIVIVALMLVLVSVIVGASDVARTVGVGDVAGVLSSSTSGFI